MQGSVAAPGSPLLSTTTASQRRLAAAESTTGARSRYVYGQEPARSKTCPVEKERLARKQVGGHGVSRERIDGEDVEVLLHVTLQRETAVSHNCVDPRSGAGQKAELGFGHRDDERIDLVEGVPISRPAVGGERAGSQADDADLSILLAIKGVQSNGDSGGGAIVGRCFPVSPGIQELNAMIRRAVEQLAVG